MKDPSATWVESWAEGQGMGPRAGTAVESLNGALFMHFWYAACGGGGGCVTAAFAHLKSRRRQSSKPGKWLCSSSAEAQEFFSDASVDTGLPVRCAGHQH